MEFLQLGQYALVWLELFDEAHRPVTVYGEPEWSSSDPAMLSCSPSSGNPGYAEIRGLKLGPVQLSVNGSYDTGKGIKAWDTVLDFEIIQQRVATGEIKVQHGEVMPIEAPGQKR